MSKNNLEWNERKYQKYLKEGRGQGHGESYIPWINVHDFSSEGMSTRMGGWHTNRLSHFLSTNELNYFYILEWSDLVVDIREQYPLLDIEAAKRIAEELGVTYPTDTVSGTPKVLTTDFMITIKINGHEIDIARTIKPAKDLENKRVLEKFEIERRYWAEKNINWGIVAEKDIPETLVRNIIWVYSNYTIENLDKQYLSYWKEILKQKLAIKDVSIGAILFQVDNDLNLDAGSSLSLLKHLIARKEIIVDMEADIDIHCSTSIIKGIKSGDEKVKAV